MLEHDQGPRSARVRLPLSPWPPLSLQASVGPTFTQHFSWPYNAQHGNGREFSVWTFDNEPTLTVISYEDFAECFSLWCEEEPDSSSSVCSTIANHLESSITVCCDAFTRSTVITEPESLLERL